MLTNSIGMDERKARLSKLMRELQGDSSLRELARKLDLSVGTVEGWVKGRSLPELDNLYRLATYTGMRPEDLVRYLDQGNIPDPYSLEQIANRIRAMNSGDLAVIARAVADRLAVS